MTSVHLESHFIVIILRNSCLMRLHPIFLTNDNRCLRAVQRAVKEAERPPQRKSKPLTYSTIIS